MLHTTYRRTLLAVVVAAASAYSWSGVARADDEAPGVARISIASGDVALRHTQDGDAVAATSNAPVEAGDYLTTGEGGRAEIQLDPNDVLRTSSNAQVRFTQLDGDTQVAQLAAGTIEVRTFDGAGHLTVQTPSADINPADTGSYFVTVDDSGNTEVTAREGRVTINTPKGSQDLQPGRTMEITGSASDPQYQFIDTVALGDFDQWAGDRDRVYLQVASRDFPYEYVNNDIVGANDLNADGRWLNVQGGEVWQPEDVGANWTPYSDGTWTNEPYYGNTWVGSEPWGWAPYHYGRWFYANNVGWVWDPGSRAEQQAWSPALVAFFNFGGNNGNLGWIPLGPGETINNTTIINHYRNYNRGFVGLPIVAWQRGDYKPIHRLRPEDVHGARVSTGRLPSAPVIGRNFRRPEFQRFQSITTNATLRRTPMRTTTEQAPRATWQRFGSQPQRTFTQPQRTFTQPQRTFTQPQRTFAQPQRTWQRFESGSPARPTYQQPTRSYQQPTRTYQEPTRSYQRPTYEEPGRSYQPPTYQRSRQPENYQRPVMNREAPRSFAPRPPNNPQRPHKPGPGGG